MSARVEAAAKGIAGEHWETALDDATAALAAADQVMFSEAARERAVERLHSVFEITSDGVEGTPEEIIAEVISALRAAS